MEVWWSNAGFMDHGGIEGMKAWFYWPQASTMFQKYIGVIKAQVE